MVLYYVERVLGLGYLGQESGVRGIPELDLNGWSSKLCFLLGSLL